MFESNIFETNIQFTIHEGCFYFYRNYTIVRQFGKKTFFIRKTIIKDKLEKYHSCAELAAVMAMGDPGAYSRDSD